MIIRPSSAPLPIRGAPQPMDDARAPLSAGVYPLTAVPAAISENCQMVAHVHRLRAPSLARASSSGSLPPLYCCVPERLKLPPDQHNGFYELWDARIEAYQSRNMGLRDLMKGDPTLTALLCVVHVALIKRLDRALHAALSQSEGDASEPRQELPPAEGQPGILNSPEARSGLAAALAAAQQLVGGEEQRVVWLCNLLLNHVDESHTFQLRRVELAEGESLKVWSDALKEIYGHFRRCDEMLQNAALLQALKHSWGQPIEPGSTPRNGLLGPPHFDGAPATSP